MEEYLLMICNKYRLKVEKVLTGGNICNAVYKVQQEDGSPLVLKIGTTERTIAEIQMNIAGYQKLKNMGLNKFIPTIIGSQVSKDSAFVLLEYCGPNFITLLRQAQKPIQLFRRLITEMQTIYFESLRVSEDSKRMIISVANKVIEQYERYLNPLDLNKALPQLRKLLNFLNSLNLRFSCFSSWDFTPEDIYLTPQGIKYGDPHEDVLGIPIIDLACFGGVVRDAYKAPGTIEGYKLLYDFAMGQVASLLEVSNEIAKKVFFLGRVLQCFLSARFRMEKEPTQALALFNQGKKYLDKIVN